MAAGLVLGFDDSDGARAAASAVRVDARRSGRPDLGRALVLHLKERCASLTATMASPQSQTNPQRLAAIREQMSLLSDYL